MVRLNSAPLWFSTATWLTLANGISAGVLRIILSTSFKSQWVCLVLLFPSATVISKIWDGDWVPEWGGCRAKPQPLTVDMWCEWKINFCCLKPQDLGLFVLAAWPSLSCWHKGQYHCQFCCHLLFFSVNLILARPLIQFLLWDIAVGPNSKIMKNVLLHIFCHSNRNGHWKNMFSHTLAPQLSWQISYFCLRTNKCN